MSTEDRKVTEKGVISSIVGSGGGSQTTVFKDSWTTATYYAKNQQVTHNGDLFISAVGHTSSAANEPGTGASWGDVWVRQVDALTTDQVAAVTGTGTPSVTNPFVTEDTLLAHDHDGTDSPKVTWANINKTTSSIADIATRAHTALSAIGTNTHTQLDSHVADVTKHRQINDSGTSSTELWSANKLLQFFTALTFANNTAFIMNVTGSYEVA